jgi:hypothetical protein
MGNRSIKLSLEEHLELIKDILLNLPYRDKVQCFKTDVVTNHIIFKFKHNLTKVNREVIYEHFKIHYTVSIRYSLFHTDRELYLEIK